MFATEGDKFGNFVDKLKTEPSLQYSLIMSGLCFYIYNELATYTLQVTGAVTASVANTAKRVVSYNMCLLFTFPVLIGPSFMRCYELTRCFLISILNLDRYGVHGGGYRQGPH
jgi:hypothetical protein